MIIESKNISAFIQRQDAVGRGVTTQLCFTYYYDTRGLIVIKSIPGKGRTFLAYDSYRRLVMIQDSNSRQVGKWSFIQYDGQSRMIKTGLISTSLPKDTIYSQASRSSNYPTLTGSFMITSETYYDSYNWISSSGTSLPNSVVTTNINSTNFNTSYNSFPDYPQPILQSARIRGCVTGRKLLVLNSQTYLYSVNFYDDHLRNIQSAVTNYSGGTDVTTRQYSFSGLTIRSHIAHKKQGNNAQTHTLLTKYSYDHAGRLKSISKNLDNSTDKTVQQNSYNELGQLSTRVIGSNIESQQLRYNLRGWLQSINGDYVKVPNSTSNYFGEAISFDYGYTTNQLNGNISGIQWKSYGDGIARSYGYSYDAASRLSQADFAQQNDGSNAWTKDKADFSVSGDTYDPSGNILSMVQQGVKVGTSATIDSLVYTYSPNSNQLQSVSDGITDQSPLGDFKDSTQSGPDYTYDGNGNTTSDLNRHLISANGAPGATFNFLDKPDSISINGKASIHYYYDAGGLELARQVKLISDSALPIQSYAYLNGFVYLNDTLQYNTSRN